MSRKISVLVKANSRRNEVRSTGENSFTVCVTASPIEGKANEQVIELLSGFFDKPKSSFTILKGETSKEKLIEIL